MVLVLVTLFCDFVRRCVYFYYLVLSIVCRTDPLEVKSLSPRQSVIFAVTAVGLSAQDPDSQRGTNSDSP
jgi:hypothetical protein